MNIAEFLMALAAVLKAIAWPFVALVLVGFFVILFRKQIERILQKNLHVKAGTFEFKASNELAAEGAAKGSRESMLATAGPIDARKFGSIYWAGFDSVTTISRLVGGESRESVIQALDQFTHHVKEIGAYRPYDIGPALQNVRQTLNEAELTSELRASLAKRIFEIARILGVSISAADMNFEPGMESTDGNTYKPD